MAAILQMWSLSTCEFIQGYCHLNSKILALTATTNNAEGNVLMHIIYLIIIIFNS